MYLSDVMISLKDTDKARKTIGFCPQHNILISELNVDEHFKFFAQEDVFIACEFSLVHYFDESEWSNTKKAQRFQFGANRGRTREISL